MKISWQIKLGVGFLLVAVTMNLFHYSIFRDPDYIFKFILAQLGFLPVSVFLVTVVINELLAQRSLQARLKKMNMVIGVFFSEVGNRLLREMVKNDREQQAVSQTLAIQQSWGAAEYQKARLTLTSHQFELQIPGDGLAELSRFLGAKREILLSLLANPNLLEHESFTDLLWAVVHLGEELAARRDLSSLAAQDHEHLEGDVQRAYQCLVQEWLAYLEHLQQDYPYLFSLAIRTNPFLKKQRAEVAAS